MECHNHERRIGPRYKGRAIEVAPTASIERSAVNPDKHGKRLVERDALWAEDIEAQTRLILVLELLDGGVLRADLPEIAGSPDAGEGRRIRERLESGVAYRLCRIVDPKPCIDSMREFLAGARGIDGRAGEGAVPFEIDDVFPSIFAMVFVMEKGQGPEAEGGYYRDQREPAEHPEASAREEGGRGLLQLRHSS